MMRIFLWLLLVLATGTVSSWAGDPNGAATIQAKPEAAVNFTWTLIAAFLVFFMQVGFALLGVGFLRSKNALNYLTKSYMDFSAGGLSYWAFGFALMFGGTTAYSGMESGNPLFGTSGFFLAGNAYDVSTLMYWMFQMVFAATAATIVAGAVAERLKFQAYFIYSFIVTAVIYPIYGHWVWGGGWLSSGSWLGSWLGGVGAVDFAGSGVVHAVGGFVALAGAMLLGPRIGKYNADGTPNAIPGHNMTFVIAGTFFLFFGWFGFNPGSTLAATDLRISVIAVNTFLAGCAGAVIIIFWSYLKNGVADILMACNGALAGLVGITAPCAYVPTWAAVIIGTVAGLLVWYSVPFVERKLKVDDPVGAISVHGTNGLWGLLSVGIFADGTYGGIQGLITGSGTQLIAQMVDCVVVFLWAFGMGCLTFWLLKKTIGIRVSREEELEGLDVLEHGVSCYPELTQQSAG